MELRLRPLALLGRLRSTYWFVPSIVTIAAVLLATGLVAIDRRSSNFTEWFGWAYGGGAEGARSVLAAVAGSTITVVSVTFSVMVVALTVASQHFGPRLLNSFMRDNAAQLVLGTFTGTFAYCLVVLRTVQGDGDGYSAFVPHLAVTGALVLTLFSVGMLIYYVHHIATSMQVSNITAGVAHDLERAINRLYPEPIGDTAALPPAHVPPVPPGAVVIHTDRSGYLQEIDGDALLALACRENVVIWMDIRPGDFLIEGRRIAAVQPVPRDMEAFGRRLRSACGVGNDRTSTQDADFAVQQLVEVALRALSPGVNEPFTAITCIDRLVQALFKLATRRIPSAVRTDADGAVRVIAQPRTFVELVEAAFLPIARHAASNAVVVRRLYEALDALAERVQRAEDREVIARLAGSLCPSAAVDVDGEPQRPALAQRFDELRRRMRVG